MKKLLILASLFCFGCAVPQKNDTPLKYSYLPPFPTFDSEKLSRDTVYETKSPVFNPVPILTGSKLLYNDRTSDLKPGLLVCEKEYGTCLIYKARVERLSQESNQLEKLRRETYDASVKAENLYQKRIVELNKSTERSWLEKNAFFIGLAIGAGTIIAGDVAFIYVTK